MEAIPPAKRRRGDGNEAWNQESLRNDSQPRNEFSRPYTSTIGRLSGSTGAKQQWNGGPAGARGALLELVPRQRTSTSRCGTRWWASTLWGPHVRQVADRRFPSLLRTIASAPTHRIDAGSGRRTQCRRVLLGSTYGHRRSAIVMEMMAIDGRSTGGPQGATVRASGAEPDLVMSTAYRGCVLLPVGCPTDVAAGRRPRHSNDGVGRADGLFLRAGTSMQSTTDAQNLATTFVKGERPGIAQALVLRLVERRHRPAPQEALGSLMSEVEKVSGQVALDTRASCALIRW